MAPCRLPARQAVAPFGLDVRYIGDIEGEKLETYYDWFALSYAVTVTSCPAISIPCGFNGEGLPVGLQIVAPPRGERAILSAARILEEAIAFTSALPVDPGAGPD